MGRRVKLAKEQVYFLRNHQDERTQKEWAEYFDCSTLTIFKALKKQGVYDYEFDADYQGRIDE